MKTTIESAGGWSTFTPKIDENAQNAFNEAIAGIVGVEYSPVAVSQQVVAGLNYRFFCNSKSVTQHPQNGVAIVSVYKPIEGKASCNSIVPIHI